MKFMIRIILGLWVVSSALWAQTAQLQEELDFRFAVELENKKLYDIAALQFARLSETFPVGSRAAEALLRAGQNYERADSLTRAAQCYLGLLLKYPQSALVDQAQFALAGLKAKTGSPMEAALAYERVRTFNAKSPLIPQAQIEAAKHFYAAGEYGRAADAALLVLDQFPTHPLRLEARFWIAKVNEQKQQYDEALKTLDRITAETPQDDLAARVYDLKVQILRKTGRFSQADSVLQKLISGKYAGEIVGAAAVQLGEARLLLREFAALDKLIAEAMPKVDARRKADLLLLQADASLLRNEYAQAQALLAQIDPGLLSLPKFAYFYRCAWAEEHLGRTDRARYFIQQALQDSIADENLRVLLLIDSSRLAAADGETAAALRTLQEVIRVAKRESDRVRAHFLAAEISAERLDDLEGARGRYHAMIAENPESAAAAEALFRLALNYAKDHQPRAAYAALNRYLNRYPAGEQREACRNLAELFAYLSGERPLPVSLAAPTNSLVLQAQMDLLLRGDYPHAFTTALAALQREKPSGQALDAFYHLAALCCYAQLESPSAKQNAFAARDSLAAIADKMSNEFPNSELTAQVIDWQTRIRLKNTVGIDRRNILLEAAKRLPAGHPLAARFRLEAAQIKELSAQERLSLLQTVEVQENTELRPQTLLLGAELISPANPDSAAALLRQVVVLDDAAVLPAALFRLAELEEQGGRAQQAKELYERVIRRFPYTDFSDRAAVHLVRLLLAEGKMKEAEELSARFEGKSLPKELRRFRNDEEGGETRRLWVQLHKRRLPPHEALPIVLDYLAEGRDVPYRTEALLAAGELMEAMGKDASAFGYYAEAAEAATDSLGKRALLKSGELAFAQGNYEAALQYYRRLTNVGDEPLKREALLKTIICEYRLGNQSRAAALEKEFNKTYKDRNAEARLLYEAGLAAMGRKDFDAAEKAFKSAAKFEDVPEGARGELGLAQLYVIQNKTEEALKRLTTIPEKYKDPELSATAWVNLASFYYTNRQLESAIGAATKVLDLQPRGPLRAQALDVLINAYDDLNLRDKAIAYEREYLDLYPYAPDAMNRRIRIGIFLYGLKEYDRAISHLKELRFLVDGEAEAEVQYWIARSYADAGLTENAVIEFLKVRYQCKPTKLPWGVTALYEAGQGYRKLGNLAKAKEMFEQVVRERGITDNIGRAAAAKIQEIEAETKKSL
ncbi:MAG: tetratricopeptide repeat protein [candidate division KSB1 bacterium]|nr:tetratricopeptide repeat protein [candidate division KSB1 bacterium]